MENPARQPVWRADVADGGTFCDIDIYPGTKRCAGFAAYHIWRGQYFTRIRLIIPGWLNIRAHDLYLAFLFFLIRYYVLPTLADYSLNTPGDMPMETEIASLFRQFIALF